MRLRWLTVLAAGALLTACVAAPVRQALPPAQVAAAETQQLARERALRAEPDWSLVGRIAVANAGHGGSGRVEWLQAGERFTIALSAPVTRQGWRLSGDPDSALLEGLEGGPRNGPDARALLLAATGWDIPVAALRQWVRGLRAPDLGPAVIDYGADRYPARIEQGGWTIDYQWPDANAGANTNVNTGAALPSRLDARRGQARVRLIVDRWSRDGALLP